MKKQYDLPEVVDKDEYEIRDIIAQIKASALPDEVKNFVIKCIELALWLPTFLQNKAISMHRLRTIIFGKGYNNKKNTKPTEPVEPEKTIDPVQSSTTDTLSTTLKTFELTSDTTEDTLTLSPTILAVIYVWLLSKQRHQLTLAMINMMPHLKPFWR